MIKWLIGFAFLASITLTYAANRKDMELLAKLSNPPIKFLDLSNADLKNYQFIPGKIDLKNANLSGADLTNANLESMDLTNANLNHANLSNAKLKGAILSKADLTCANLNNADLTKANVSEAIISGATFINTITTEISNYESVIDAHVECK